MSEAVYVATASVVKVKGVHRRATLTEGTTVDFGVHGPIKSVYGLEDQPDLPLPVDFVVAAACG